MTDEVNIENKPVIGPDLVVLDLTAQTNEEVVAQLAQRLVDRGWVEDGFMEAILNREREYPTGLPTGNTAAAIPHTDAAFIRNSAMVTAVLKTPVSFRNMADPDEELPVRIVFLLAMKEPALQVSWLKKLISLLCQESAMNKLLEIDDPKQMSDFLNELL
ncbi:MAG: PTS sugar transporter subunit IIA [Anaerolineaceae bacterium]